MSEWKMVKLGEVCNFVSGFAFDSKCFIDTGNGMPLIRIRDIVRGYSNTFYTGEYDDKYIVKKGDFLIGMDGEFNIGEWTGVNALLNQRVCKILPHVNKLNDRFLFYYLPKRLKDIESKTAFVTVKHLSVNSIKDIEIPLPPLDEQKKISNVLDQACGLIQLRKAQIEKLDLLVKSKFIDMFGDPVRNCKGWQKEPLGEHADILAGNPFNSKGYTVDGIKICGGLIIMPDRIVWEDAKHWPSFDGLNNYLLQSGDIVLAMDRPWISGGFKIAQIKEKELPTLLIQRTARIRGTDVNQIFILWMLKDNGFERHCNITQTTVPHISMGDIKNYEIIVPPIALQTQFADFVEQVEQQKAVLNQSLEKLELNYKALLQGCFNGEFFE